MAVMTCSCLNVSVYVTNTAWQQDPIPIKNLFSNECEKVRDPSGLLYEVHLDVAGIIVEIKALVCSRRVEDWIISSCCNCHTDVYVTHAIKIGRTLVTSGLLSDLKEIKRRKQLEKFSSSFNIVIEPVEEDMTRRRRVSSMSFGREDPDMKLIHQQMKRCLKVEEEAMEARIRCYEKEQRDAFLSHQNKAHSERRNLFTAIAKARENAKDRSVMEKLSSSQLHTSMIKPADIQHKISPSDNTSQEIKNVTVTETKKVTITIKDDYSLTQIYGENEPLEDSLFTLEGFDEEQSYVDEGGTDIGEIAFPQSDDDVSTDDSSFRDISVLSGMNMASSVPVGIPLFQKPSNEVTDSCAGVNNNENNFDVDDVGNSIRQLALSVQDTGMFGDLPRPRIMNNTQT